MHGPVLPGALVMSDTRTEERHCSEPCHRKDATNSHHGGAQFSGNLLHKCPACNCNHRYSVRSFTFTSPSHSLFFKFFVLDVYNSDGTPLTVDQLYMQLEKIWNSSLQTNKEPIGILTSNHRNTWGKAYNNLIKGELQYTYPARLT